MAPPAQIKEGLPETLPGDFVQWDEASQSTQAAQPPDAVPGPGVVSKPATEVAEVNAAGPSGDLPRGAALSRSVPESGRGAAAPHWPRSVNGAPAPSRNIAAPVHAAKPAVDEFRFSAPPPQSAPAAATMAGFHGSLLQGLRGNAVKISKVARQKWPIIAAVSAALVVILAAAAIPVLKRSIVPSAQPPAAPASQMTPLQQPEAPASSRPHSKSAVRPSTTAEPSPAAERIGSEALPGPPQKNAGISREQAKMMEHQLHTPAQLRMKATPPEPASLQPGGFDSNAIHGLENSNAIGAAFGSAKEPRVQIASQQVISSQKPMEQVAPHQAVTVPPGVALSLLVQNTQPVYPLIAKSARISGTVVLAASISPAGRVENLRVVSGPDMLRKSAVDAVRTWRFKPYMLNNQPAAIETTINLHFSLN